MHEINAQEIELSIQNFHSLKICFLWHSSVTYETHLDTLFISPARCPAFWIAWRYVRPYFSTLCTGALTQAASQPSFVEDDSRTSKVCSCSRVEKYNSDRIAGPVFTIYKRHDAKLGAGQLELPFPLVDDALWYARGYELLSVSLSL